VGVTGATQGGAGAGGERGADMVAGVTVEPGGPTVVRVSGPLIELDGMGDAHILDLVDVGHEHLIGEVISLRGERAIVQAHEYTGGLAPGAPAWLGSGPLTAELGPGLIGGVFDGMLRRLPAMGERLVPGARAPTLDPERRWRFTPRVRPGEHVSAGAVLGTVPESEAIQARILAPPDVAGTLEWVAAQGDYTTAEPIARVGGRELRLAHQWPLRTPRPSGMRIGASLPLRTGQRALDLLFPVARGSTAAVPGGFGTGKTVLLQQIAKWCDADVIVYVSCGERGNELADLLEEISALQDPRTGRSLLDRTVMIANTSNMPLMARELSVYAGATVAELYRDMGYDALVIADSTSRWAEALRELASRTGELPAEEGFPASLAPALASFYERSGRVQTLAGGVGSVTILGAVSPPGGDMAEPVTAHTGRFVRTMWSLDRDLAYARHYPAVSWTASSSRDVAPVADWHAEQGDMAWAQRRGRAVALLADADRVQTVAELVGVASLPGRERIVLITGRLLREAVLQQSALSDNDARCGPAKQAALLAMVLDLHDRALELVSRGVPAARIEELDLSDAARARDLVGPDDAAGVEAIADKLLARLGALG
jgi:V/A-type H+-transporting ATPase subunit A